MNLEVILTIVGAVLSILISINAFLLSKLTLSINSVRIELTEIVAEHKFTVRGVAENKSDLRILNEEIRKARERLHSLEGASVQILKSIEEKVIR